MRFLARYYHQICATCGKRRRERIQQELVQMGALQSFAFSRSNIFVSDAYLTNPCAFQIRRRHRKYLPDELTCRSASTQIHSVASSDHQQAVTRAIEKQRGCISYDGISDLEGGLRQRNPWALLLPWKNSTKARKQSATLTGLQNPSQSTPRTLSSPKTLSDSSARPKSASKLSQTNYQADLPSRQSLAHSRSFFPARLAAFFMASSSSLEKRSEKTSRVLRLGSFGRPRFFFTLFKVIQKRLLTRK
jgi:hypothetical protein